jgi:hypothetical protein
MTFVKRSYQIKKFSLIHIRRKTMLFRHKADGLRRTQLALHIDSRSGVIPYPHDGKSRAGAVDDVKSLDFVSRLIYQLTGNQCAIKHFCLRS